MIFRLSNNQKKDLLIRAQPLRIVLPAPRDVPDNPAELLTWARDALRESRAHVKKVWRDDICILPNGGDGLSGIIGQIAQGQPEGLCWWIDCIVCDLDPIGTKPRHGRSQAQWPGAAVTEKRQWPAVKQAEAVKEVAAGD